MSLTKRQAEVKSFFNNLNYALSDQKNIIGNGSIETLPKKTWVGGEEIQIKGHELDIKYKFQKKSFLSILKPTPFSTSLKEN